MGFWEPHSSSIDFCESNYLHSDYVVEFHNTWSSIVGLSSLGVVGLFFGNPTNEKRYLIAYYVLIGIGLGSTGLHGTLNWIFQSSDELPMIYLVMSLYYMCAEYDAPKGKPNYPSLPMILSSATALLTAIYYAFQNFYMVFVLSFIAETGVVLVWFYRILFMSAKRHQQTKRLGIVAISSLVLVGFPLWVFDMMHCNAFINVVDTIPFWFIKGVTPHIIWHFAAGYGAYCAILCLCCCRMEELDIPYDCQYMLGLLPAVFRKEVVTEDEATELIDLEQPE